MLRFGLIVAAVIFVADQVSKYLVLHVLDLYSAACFHQAGPCESRDLSPIFDLTMVWNRGISFGLFRADNDFARWGLVLAMLAIAGVFAWWLRTAERRVSAISLGLVIGGALGNVIDRIRFGAVADFLDFSGLGFFPWVFNVADAAISVGAVLLAADMLLFTESEAGKGTGWDQIKARLPGPRGGPGGGAGG